jgi:glutathione synthase/RimK-type ligase-like ATP-grasp enzyme
MKRVGLLVGRERSFPDALIAEVARRDTGVTAEYAKIGAPRMAEKPQYDVIVDRISHEIPMYAPYLKNAALQGAVVINDPFWRMADDKFFAASVADAVGVAAPKTVVLPNKSYIPGVVSESLRNLVYPLDWHDIVNYTGMPAILKPSSGGGWRDVHRVESLEELQWRYDATGTAQYIV